MEFDLSVLNKENPYNINIEKFIEQFYGFIQINHLYDSAIHMIETKLEIIDSEFQSNFSRNPIHNISSRLKSPESIANKLIKKGIPITAESILSNLHDIAGVRVICHYIEDIYQIAHYLSMHDDIRIIKQKDYIQNPKPSGYRSLHLIVTVPVYLSTGKKVVPVEIQIRTIAMDFWASLEHQLRYKTKNNVPADLSKELRSLADTINSTDMRMEDIYHKINDLDDEE
ncbi:GTP pyrophosphokinase family protein [Ruminococcus sp. HUN007]|jgi:putative GTP pyrophosphokinase|uniref:GTP pyrophosphokinase n=1 Tax=Ruminococcus sp. HUN007 TaxID=1514668 RepID=UPI00067853E7|nr:GTP pyrophosphokinase family protein [Ruminococcus sp. HUN007]